jgi:hypothetical protein
MKQDENAQRKRFRPPSALLADSAPPITGAPAQMRDRNDPNAIRLDLVNHTKWESSHLKAAGMMLFSSAYVRMRHNVRQGAFDCIDKCFSDEATASFVNTTPIGQNSFPASR